MTNSEMTRRSFVGLGAAAATAVGVAGLAGGSVAAADEAAEDEAETEETETEETATDVPAWLGTAPVIDEADIAEEYTADLVIVGAGNAGMAAAAKAAELGLDFILINKNSIPGDVRSFIGAINDDTAIEAECTEDVFTILRELVRYSSGKMNTELVRGWALESGEAFNWLAGIMDEYGYDAEINTDTGIEDDPAYYCACTEHSFSAREDSEWADADRHDILLDYIQQRGYDMMGSTSLVELVQDDEGAVCGVIAQNTNAGTYLRINAANVLLTTGGYGDNPEMMEAIAPAAAGSLAAWMVYPGNDGQGIKAAMWAGADKDPEPTPMLFDRGAVAPGTKIGMVKDGDAYSVPLGYITTSDEYNPGTQPFLKVNLDGERFANESGPYTDIIWAAQNQPGNTYAQIFDASYTEDWEAFHTLGCSSLARKIPAVFSAMVDSMVEAGTIVKADTLEELAAGLGFEGDAVDTFLATVERYNELYDTGEDTDFGKPAFRLSEVREAPFYGVWMGANLLTTADGIKIDANCQALDTDHNPIPGLYAAGDCAGSFFANNYPYLFPGIACGRAIYEAWKAVKVIAGEE